MKTMTLTLIMSFLTTSAFAGSDPLSLKGSGQVEFSASNFMADCGMPSLPTAPGSDDSSSFNCNNSKPHYSGNLIITGDAAEKIYVAMNAVTIHPEAADVDSKPETSLSWDDIEYKKGADIWCFKKPGKVAGKPTRTTVCRIEYNSLYKGELK